MLNFGGEFLKVEHLLLNTNHVIIGRPGLLKFLKTWNKWQNPLFCQFLSFLLLLFCNFVTVHFLIGAYYLTVEIKVENGSSFSSTIYSGQIYWTRHPHVYFMKIFQLKQPQPMCSFVVF